MKGELIGLTVKVTESTNATLKGVEGVVEDETKHFITIKTATGVKKIPKHTSTFAFQVNGKTHTVKGAEIEVSPEERIKLKV